MFIHISFPIADLRSFATRGGLTKPTWPNPQEAPQRPGAVEKGLQLAWGDFVRSVGVVRGRAKGGLPGFASEDVYADARGAIKFDTSALASSQGLNSRQVKIIFRRLYCTGGPVVHLDIGFLITPSQQQGLSIDKEFLQNFLSAKVTVGKQETMLFGAGYAFANHFRVASTKHKTDSDSKHVQSGPPVIVIEAGPRDTTPSRTVPTSLSLVQLSGAGRDIPVWILAPASFDGPTSLRALRLTLVRLRAEREALKQVLRAADQGTLIFEARTPGGDRLSSYLRKADRLFKGQVPDELKGISIPATYPEILVNALQADELFRPGAASRLASSFNDIRPNLLRKLNNWSEKDEQRLAMMDEISSKIDLQKLDIDMSEKNVTISGSSGTVVTIGDNAQVTANIGVNTGRQEVDDLLKKLLDQVNAAMAQVPPDDAEVLKRHAESIANEAHKETPNRKWYEVSAEGLKEAAQAVAGIAPSIATTLAALTKVLFLG